MVHDREAQVGSGLLWSRRRFGAVALALGFVAVAPACTLDDGLTADEAKKAVEQASYVTQVGALQADFGEVSTDFTMAEGAQKAAETLRDFWKSQAPCADVQLQGLTVTVQWGAKGSGCVWRGKTWTGTTSTTLLAVEANQVKVRHDWVAFSDGVWSVSGTDTVSWQANPGKRTSVASWTATGVGTQVAGKELDGTHALTHQLVDPSAGLSAGILIDGERTWTGEGGTWVLTVSGVEARGADPVPQAGRYTLVNPDKKAITMTFTRLDASRIRVEVAFGKHSFRFVVRQIGTIEQADS